MLHLRYDMTWYVVCLLRRYTWTIMELKTKKMSAHTKTHTRTHSHAHAHAHAHAHTHAHAHARDAQVSRARTLHHTTTRPHDHTTTHHTTTQPHNHTTTQPHNHTTTQPHNHIPHICATTHTHTRAILPLLTIEDFKGGACMNPHMSVDSILNKDLYTAT